MKKILFNFSVAIFTLCLGIFSGSIFTESLTESLSANERLERALRKVYTQNIERRVKEAEAARKKRENRVAFLETIKQLPGTSQNHENIDRLISSLENQEIKFEIPSNQEPQTAEEIERQIISDLEAANLECGKKEYSEERCDQIKENAINDIESNVLQ